MRWTPQLRLKAGDPGLVGLNCRSVLASGMAGARNPEDAVSTWALCLLPLLSSALAHFPGRPLHRGMDGSSSLGHVGLGPVILEWEEP